MERATKRVRLAATPESLTEPGDINHFQNTPAAGVDPGGVCAAQPLVVMVLDVEEGPAGSFYIWGRTSEGLTILVKVHDYCPYLYVSAPVRVARGDTAVAAAAAGAGGDGDGASSGAGTVCGGAVSAAAGQWSEGELEALRAHWNSRLQPDCRISSITVVHTRPIMYYRPAAPHGAPYLRLVLRPGGSSKRAGSAVSGLMAGREGPLLERLLGMRFADRAVHEAEVKLLMRFLCDTALSGGAWLLLPPPPPPPPPHPPPPPSPPRHQLHYTPVELSARISTCDLEVAAPWRSLQSLTPDATQLADPDWCPEVVRQTARSADSGGGADGGGGGASPREGALRLEPQLANAVLAARDGHIAPLTVMTVDVLAVPYDTTNRTPVTSKDDPVICIGCDVRVYGMVTERAAPVPAPPAEPRDASCGAGAAAAAAAAEAAVPGAGAGETPCRVVFLVAGGELTHGSPLPRVALQGGELRCFDSEREMLLAWKRWCLDVDPDMLVTFQVRDTLGALRDRFERLRLEGGGLMVSRMAPLYGSAGGSASPMTVKSVVMYSVAWVKRQGRMSSTSNQETFLGEIRGRLVVDLLRQVLTSQSLSTFSLVDCCQSLLGETLELLRPLQLARLAAEAAGRQALPSGSLALAAEGGEGHGEGQERRVGAAAAAAAAAARISSYIARRVDVIVRLTSRLATLPEAFEMARVTGLTVQQVLYNAQMIRTWSLLHRNAHRQNYIIGGRQEAGNLIESPFLMHPIENRTAGLYRSPVATLDFASLYPSLYRAHNLCYTTLVHPDDVEAVGRDLCGFTPTGHAFVKPEVRHGILPTILAALMSARAATRAKLKSVQHDSAASAVLDSRQKALKVTANALYGFTGAAASPLQCLPLADSCLALGAGACRAAIAAITAALESATAAAAAAAGRGVAAAAAEAAGEGMGAKGVEGTGGQREGGREGDGKGEGEGEPLGPAAAGGRVIYAQTDSVFVHFPRATPLQAVQLGKKAASLVNARLPPPLELKYERVLAPFLLLHVNRYAGRALEGEVEAEQPESRGSLLVKGVRSMWRQSAPFVSAVLQGSLERILMRDDVADAVSYTESQIRRLLSGRVELGELAMTGGLWRVTGQQVAAAAAGENDGNGGGGGGGGPSPSSGGEDVRGPHAALAVRLSHRDPGRRFLLGERLGYVLLAGARTQDEAAEDPLTAAQRGAAPALELYWRNKLQPPLKELFAVCLPPPALQALLSGPHTLIRVEASLDTTLADSGGGGAGPGGGAAASAAVGGPLLAGPGSPRPRRRGECGGGGGGGGGFGLAMLPRTPPSAGKGRGAKHGGGGGSGGGGTQSGLSAFFRQTAKCLACKRALPPQNGDPGGDVATAPGLCSSCMADPDTLPASYLRLLREDNAACARLAAALAVCSRCHSGGRLGAVLCENGECGALFARLGAVRRLSASGERLERLD